MEHVISKYNLGYDMKNAVHPMTMFEEAWKESKRGIKMSCIKITSHNIHHLT